MKIKEMIKNSVTVMAKMSDGCLMEFVTSTLPLIIEGAENYPTQMLILSKKADTCTVVDSDLSIELTDLMARGSDEFYVFDAKHGVVIPVVGDKPMGGSILHILKTIEKTSEEHLPETITVMNGSKPKDTSPLEDFSSEQLEKAFDFLDLMERILQHD